MRDERHMSFKAQLDSLPAVRDFVVEGAHTAGLDDRAVYHCQLAVDEACTNIIQHGLDQAPNPEDLPLIEVITGVDDKNAFVIMISDPTPAFNPLDHDDPNPRATLEEREEIGGWGIYFIKKLMDAVDYRYINGKNRLTLHKMIAPHATEDADLPQAIQVSSKPLAKNYWQLNLAGRLDSKTSGELEAVLKNALAQEHYRLIVNMDGVEYISSSGLKALVSAWRVAREQGGDVVLTNLQPRIREIFDMIGFDMMFQIFNTPADVLKADPIE